MNKYVNEFVSMYFSNNYVISLHLRGEYVRKNHLKQKIFATCAKMLTSQPSQTKYFVISDRPLVVERIKIQLGKLTL